MNRICLVILCLLMPALSVAQQANVNLDYNPQKNTENLTPFSAPLNSPDVRDDRTVTFRVRAPEAKNVALTGPVMIALDTQGRSVPFKKGENGIWSLTVGPIEPDMYIYYINVDGVQMADPSNTIAGFTAMPPYSQLVGGSGDLPSNWVYDGRANFMMDNLLAEGKAKPMIIAIPNNQVLHRNHPRHVELTFDLFEQEMRKHVIPLVESEYSVIKNPKGRAISGLSMGGRHSMFVGFRNLDLFANFGILSAGDNNSETSIKDFLNDPDVNEKVDYLFVGQGTHEATGRMGTRCVRLHEALEKHKIEHEYYVGGHGAHDWATWRHLLYYRFLPNLWRKN
jgi:hypothetical protein